VFKETNSDSQALFPGSLLTHISLFIQIKRRVKTESQRFVSAVAASCCGFLLTHFLYVKRPTYVKRHPANVTHSLGERWGAGVETQKNVREEIGGWGRVPFNEPYAPSLSTIYDGA